MRWKTALGGLTAGLSVICCGPAGATGLQVAPIGLELTPASPTQGLWLTNTGDRELHAQVRVFHWIQVDGKDELASTQALVVSPPMLDLQPGGRQLVRVIRTGGPAAAGASEDAFRVWVDELPQPGEQQNSGVQYVLRYSIPVFVGPVNPPDAVSVATALHWSFARANEQVALQVQNTGTYHAQIANLSLVPSIGAMTEVSSGLLGYVLPGMTMRWPLQVPPNQITAGTTLKVRINGKPIDQAIPVGELPR
jgi:fimbrial chaperone protein